MSRYNVVTSASAEASARGQGVIVRLLLGLLRWFGYTPEQPPQGQVVVRINQLEKVDPDTGLTELGRAIVSQADPAYIRALVRMGADFLSTHSKLVPREAPTALDLALFGKFNQIRVGSALELALRHNPAALAVLREERPEAVQQGLNELLNELIEAAEHPSCPDDDERRAFYVQGIELALAAGARFCEGAFLKMWNAIRWRRLPGTLGDKAMATRPTLNEVFRLFIWYTFEGLNYSSADKAQVEVDNTEGKPLLEKPGYNHTWETALRDMPEAVLLYLFNLGLPLHQMRIWATDSILEFCLTEQYTDLAAAIIAKAPEVVPTTPEGQKRLLAHSKENNPVLKLLLAHPAFQAFTLEAQPSA